MKSTCSQSGKLSAVASFHAPPAAQLRIPSIAAFAAPISEEADALLPLVAKATFVLPVAGVGVITGVGVGVAGVGVTVGVGVGLTVGVLVGVAVGVDVGIDCTVTVLLVATLVKVLFNKYRNSY